MNPFSAIAESMFKKDPSGRRVFFPQGANGRGLVVPSEDEYRRVRGVLSLTRNGLVAFVGAFALLPIPIWAALLLLVPAWFAERAWLRNTTQHWAPSHERISRSEVIEAQAKAYDPRFLWLLFFGSLLLFLGSAVLAISDPKEHFASVLGVPLFGAGTLVSLWMLRLKNEKPLRW